MQESQKNIIISSGDHPPLIQGDKSPEKNPGGMTDIVKAAFKTQGVQVNYYHLYYVKKEVFPRASIQKIGRFEGYELRKNYREGS